MEAFRFYAYDITRCGYYKYGKEKPEFGGIANTLQEIQLWVQSKTLADTNLYTPPENSEKLPAYCFSIDQYRSNANLWLIITWNKTHDSEDGIRIANGAAKVGEITVTNQSIGPTDIPGFPSYFLIMANEGLLFNILPDGQRHSGHHGMCDFIESFMKGVSSHAVIDPNPEDTDKAVTGYRENEASQIKPLHAYFRTRLKRVPGRLDFIRQNVSKIRKIIRSTEVSTGVAKEKTLLNKLMGAIGLERPIYGKKELRLNYAVDYRPTPEEIDTIIEGALNDADHNDVGFKMSTGNTVYWVNRSTAKCDLQLSIISDDDIYPASQLLEQLNLRKDILLKSTEA